MVPKPFIYVGLTLLVLALVPPALIARARTRTSPLPRIHIIQDMDNQSNFKAQQSNPLFADGRAMRPIVPGTVARGELATDTAYHMGVSGGDWTTTFPAQVRVTERFMKRGQERFAIYCTPCHGDAGYGDGAVHQRAMELVNTGVNGTQWVAPKSLHDPEIRTQPVGQVYNTVTNGIRTMSGYAAQIPIDDRWAIVAYVKALQRSQHARPGDVPASEREDLPYRDLVPETEE
jgi:mono/diheme cytochrome c family protein